MPHGICTNFDEPCPKHVSKEPQDIPEGADFTCIECGYELMAVKRDGAEIPRNLLLILPALLLLGGAGYAFTIFFGSDEAAPDMVVAEAGVVPQVASETVPTPAAPRYIVPVVDFDAAELPKDARDLASYLILHPALPAGKTLNTDAATTTDRAAAPVGYALLTQAELEEVATLEANALGTFRQRWEEITRETERKRSNLLRSLPARCTEDVEALIAKITRLGTNECPRMPDNAERNECYLEVQRLNSKLGDCETRNQVYEEARRLAYADANRYQQSETTDLEVILRREAETHNRRLTDS